MSSWNDPELKDLFLSTIPLIDVRAPIEFQAGSIPGSINLPILTNEERALIGTCYKEKGQEAAIILGHQLVTGSVKQQRVKSWTEAILRDPRTEVFCFRGGLRSQISCEWLAENGIQRKPINGGYKRLRQFLLSYLEQGPAGKFIRLGGVTGSGKTRLLSQVRNSLDLEEMANHRGSAFGYRGEQPSQVRFENELSLGLLKNEGENILVEDESQMIGKRQIPLRHFSEIRKSPLIILKVSETEQAQNIFNDYVKGSSQDFFLEGLEKIKTRLKKEILIETKISLKTAFDKGSHFSDHEEWISLLLKHYYNPLYLKDILKQKEKVIFEGASSDVLEFLDRFKP